MSEQGGTFRKVSITEAGRPDGLTDGLWECRKELSFVFRHQSQISYGPRWSRSLGVLIRSCTKNTSIAMNSFKE